MKKDTLYIIEGICYLYPHIPELCEDSLSMQGTWKHSLRLLAKHKHAYLAPLLVDDLVREKVLTEQTVDSLLAATIGKTFVSLQWFGKPVLESKIEAQYGNLGCKLFDALYHKDIIASLSLLSQQWKWIAVHPTHLQKQQAGMLLDLWQILSEHISVSAVSNKTKTRSDTLRAQLRDEFLSHFEHHWIAKDGTVENITRPIYKGKKIVHAPITK